MLAKIPSASVIGIEGYMACVEVDIRSGMPSIVTVGLPDAAVKEAKDRVAAAMRNSGYRWPTDRVTINYAPGDVRKEGSSFDLPTALGLLAASGQLQSDQFGDFAAVGETALDGSLRPVRGCLAAAMACRDAGLRGMIVPGGKPGEPGFFARRALDCVGNRSAACRLPLARCTAGSVSPRRCGFRQWGWSGEADHLLRHAAGVSTWPVSMDR